MKLDPDMHIGLHLVFFGKTGVTFSFFFFCLPILLVLANGPFVWLVADGWC
jgi:hypothetical protein